MKYKKGFSLIELMIVIAIIGVLTSFAMPAYKKYVVRTRVSEGLHLSSSAKLTVMQNSIMGDNFSSGYNFDTKSKNIESISVNDLDGKINIKYTDIVENIELILTPTIGDETLDIAESSLQNIVWQCATTSINKIDFLPNSCKNLVK